MLKKTVSQSKHPPASNFWFGFSLGIVATGAFVYLFATENGRKNLKKILDLTENLEGTINDLSEELTGNPLFNNEQIDNGKKSSETIHSLLSKIKDMSPLFEKKQVKKFFVKEGKLLEGKK